MPHMVLCLVKCHIWSYVWSYDVRGPTFGTMPNMVLCLLLCHIWSYVWSYATHGPMFGPMHTWSYLWDYTIYVPMFRTIPHMILCLVLCHIGRPSMANDLLFVFIGNGIKQLFPVLKMPMMSKTIENGVNNTKIIQAKVEIMVSDFNLKTSVRYGRYISKPGATDNIP